jgi:hypothetical protein
LSSEHHAGKSEVSSHQACDLGIGNGKGNGRRRRRPRHAQRPGYDHVLLARALIIAGNHIDHAVTAHPSGAEADGEDPPDQEELVCKSRRRWSRQPAGHYGGDEQVTGARNDPPPHRYRIRVRGRLGETMRSAFPALQARATGGDTVLTGPLLDRAALHGVLAEIEALGLELLEVRRLPPA